MSAKGMSGLILVLSVAAASPQAQAPQAVVIEIAGPTWLAKGGVIGGKSRWTVKLGESIEAFQSSGRTLCEASSAVSRVPSDAGFGWRLQLTAVGPGNEPGSVVAAVEWERLWDQGAAIKAAPNRARVTLVPGQHTMLDFLSATPAATGCDALGMGLQIGIPTVESNDVAEANVWLIRSSDGVTLERQSIRARVGTNNEFHFRNVEVDGTIRQVRGDLTVTRMNDSSIAFTLELAQRIAGASMINATFGTAGSASIDVTARPQEVVEFKMPYVGTVDPSKGERLLFRIQIARLK